MLVIAPAVLEGMVAHCLDDAPLEACGLLAGAAPAEGPATATRHFPATNASGSARVYTVEPRDMLRADRAAEDSGLTILGVYHSHTHTDAYPSPTDVDAAPDPGWHYVLVSLRDVEPSVRSYRVVDRRIEEEPVAVQ